MKEKVGKSQRTGLVMDCTDFVVLAFLFIACGTTLVFAHGRKELNEYCLTIGDCNRIGYMCFRNYTCQCGVGYIPNEKRTKCLGFVGSNCNYDSHCTDGAYCTGLEGSEKCKCKEKDNFYPSEDGKACINSAISRHHQNYYFAMLLTLLCSSLYLNT